MSNAEVSIIIPNYKTPFLTKLCLRSLRKYTDCSKIKVIAIDNKSDDESVEYLLRKNGINLNRLKTKDIIQKSKLAYINW